MFFHKKIILPVILIMMAGTTFFSCTSDKKELVKPCETSVPDTISFKKDVIPVFHGNCSLSSCHSGPTPQRNLNLEDSVAYSQLMRPGTGYIDTVNPEFSVLYIQMTTASQIMPPTGRLDDCKVQLIHNWIQQGAKNN